MSASDGGREQTGPMIRSAVTGGMVRAHHDDCYGANDHAGPCPTHDDDLSHHASSQTVISEALSSQRPVDDAPPSGSSPMGQRP